MPYSELQIAGKVKLIACATVIEEMMPLLPKTYAYEVLDFGLHLAARNLRQSLQRIIDQSSKEFDIVIFGYGLCSLAVVGLEARDCTLVIPRVDDCIAIFLGSGNAYSEQAKKEPGTYYLTKGWIEVGDTLLNDYQNITARYGEEKAKFVMGEMLRNYKRLVYIDTGTANQEKYRAYAYKVAETFGLCFEEVRGSNALVRKILYGPWEEDFVIAPPGHTVTYLDFKGS